MKKKFYYSFLLLTVIIVATAGVLSPTHANPDTFGKTNAGAKSETYWNWNSKWGSRFKCPADGTVTQIRYYGRLVAGSETVNFCVYSDNAGAPDKLLGYGSTTMSTTAQWYTVTGLSVSVTANTYYWLTVNWGGFNIYYYYDEGATNQFIYQKGRADVPPPDNSFGSGTYLAREMSIYATYTPSGLDTKAPTYSNVGTNTTVAGNPCMFRAEWSDDFGLGGFIFGTNNTGTWQNTTWIDPWTGTPTSGWSNISITLNSTKGIHVGYRFWCNDTSNNWADTGIHYIVTTHNPVRAVVIHSDFSYILPEEYIRYDDAIVFGVLQGAGIPYDIKPANEMADVKKLKEYSLIVFPHHLAWRLPENLTEAVIAACNDGVGVWTVGQGPGAENEEGQARSPMFISRLNNVNLVAWESMTPQLVVSSTYIIDGYYNPGDVVGVAQTGPKGLPKMEAFDPSRPYHEVVSVFSEGSYKGSGFVASTLGEGRAVWSIGDPVIWQAHGILIRMVRWATKSPVFLELADSPSGMFLQIRIDADSLEWYLQAYKEFMWKIGNITDARVSFYFVSDVTTEEEFSIAKQYPQNEYGSHSKTHVGLVKLSPEALEEELNGSKSVIEAKLGWEITGFAYPFNSFNKTTTAGASAYDYVYIGNENNMSCVFPNSVYLQRPPDTQTTGLDTYSVFTTSIGDYTLFALQGLDPPTVLQIWKNHFNLAAKQAEVSESNDIMCQLWHIKEMEMYGITIYFDFLDWVVNKGGRFITAQEMVQSVKELEAVNMEYVKSGNVIKVTLDGSLSQGHPLRLFNSTDNIQSVNVDGQSWSNFRDKVVVLPSLGPGEHNIELTVGPVPTATIRGTVTDSGTGNPIETVNVTCDGASTSTALDGTYSFTVTLGSYTLTFEKPGYVSETRTQDCPAVGEYVVNVTLEPITATITGTVTDNKTGAPIEAVRVMTNGLEAFTNSSGVYALVVRLGSYTLTFEKTGYYTNTATMNCPTEGTYTVNISLVPLPPPPQPPVNYELVIEDMDEGNKLYAMHKFYHFTVKAHDNDGDISVIKIAFTDGATWANFSFTVSDRTFSRLSGYPIAELNLSDCSYEIGGEWVNATFSIRIKYGVDDAPDIELYQLSEDTLGNTSGWQTMQTDYANIIKPSVSAPNPLGSIASSMAMVGSLAGAAALWILWRKREEKEEIRDDALPPIDQVCAMR